MKTPLLLLLVAGLPALAQAPATSLPAPATEPPKIADPAKPAEPPKPAEPFAFADFTWMNSVTRNSESILDSKYFTGEFRSDTSVTHSFNNPSDHSLVGSTQTGRVDEVQLQHLGVGGDFHFENVRGRILTQFGTYGPLNSRNDPSSTVGQWDSQSAYRYVAEAYGGYHFDVMHGLNVDAGIFMSYIGLFSYYGFDNWAYQPSYVSANTPWFFNGVRFQLFPTDKLKLELWLTNGWQSYNSINHSPGIGGSVTWRPNENWGFISNDYFTGEDSLGNPQRKRRHTDNSILWKEWESKSGIIKKAALSFTFDLGDEQGDGVSRSGTPTAPKQYMAGWMLYQRLWFSDKQAMTVGGGYLVNPGRYLALLPPINGATAASGTPYFTENPGDTLKQWDFSLTYDYMPNKFITFRNELNRRFSNVPYFAGSGGVTPPGGNQGAPGSAVAGWAPDLRKTETRITTAMLVKF